ncbi:hypothetical protein FGO68_gene17299 [Halteria grandinella]|uniref:Uncharacterized protein n=1 Tax=Halteria grandinella TaxID=5974 RepID=A0A8J8NZM8_HALGN|nr:hypothetical protein FGO68_gene17299 [Halteria grandinella]
MRYIGQQTIVNSDEGNFVRWTIKSSFDRQKVKKIINDAMNNEGNVRLFILFISKSFNNNRNKQTAISMPLISTNILPYVISLPYSTTLFIIVINIIRIDGMIEVMIFQRAYFFYLIQPLIFQQPNINPPKLLITENIIRNSSNEQYSLKLSIYMIIIFKEIVHAHRTEKFNSTIQITKNDPLKIRRNETMMIRMMLQVVIQSIPS